MRTIWTLSLALVGPCLTLAPVTGHAFTPPASDTGSPSIITQVPGTAPVNAGGFLNVRRLFDLYGHLIQQLPQFSAIEQLVAAGFPDPRTDIAELGLVTDLDARDPNVAGLVTGNVSPEAVMAVARAMGIEFQTSAYRGIELYTAEMRRRSVQLGFIEGRSTLFSVNDSGEHELSRMVIETVAGQRESFGAVNQVALPANYILDISLQVTDSLRELLAYLGDLGRTLHAASLINLVLTAEDATKDATAVATFRMTDAGAADRLERILKQMVAEFERQASPGDREIFRSIAFARDGQVLSLTVTITEQAMQRWVSRP